MQDQPLSGGLPTDRWSLRAPSHGVSDGAAVTLDFIRGRAGELRSVQISWRELSRGRGVSQSQARRHVAELADRGLLFVEAVNDREAGCQANRFHLPAERRR